MTAERATRPRERGSAWDSLSHDLPHQYLYPHGSPIPWGQHRWGGRKGARWTTMMTMARRFS